MSAERVAGVLLCAVVVAGTGACESEEGLPRPRPPVVESTGGADAGGAGGSGGVAGAAGAGATADGGGGAAPAEDCFDGLDGDGDGEIDCLDEDPDCEEVCDRSGDACDGIQTLDDPEGAVLGDNTEHAAVLGTSCATTQPGLDGPAIVYRFTAQGEGILDAQLVSEEDLTLSARTSCADPESELGCSDGDGPVAGQECLHLAVAEGTEVLLVVQGYSFLDYGPFELSAMTRPRECGDDLIDPPETCDDGNDTPGDGCDADCSAEIAETEDNGSAALADPFAAPWIGAISPAGDVDFVAFDVTGTADDDVSATTMELPGDGCFSKLIDSYLELYDSDGTTVLASDDDSGDTSLHAALDYSGLLPGTYYLVVKASPAGPPLHTFGYRLVLTTN